MIVINCVAAIRAMVKQKNGEEEDDHRDEYRLEEEVVLRSTAAQRIEETVIT